MKFNKKLLILTIVLSFIFCSAVYAENSDTQNNNIKISDKTIHNKEITKNTEIIHLKANKIKLNNTKKSKKTKINKNLKTGKVGCCSVYLQVNKNESVLSYRRDSTYSAPLYITKSKTKGIKILKEYKKVKGYFFHTIVTSNGWIIGTGGADIPYLNKNLEKLAIKMASNNNITKKNMKLAQKYIKQLGIGHFAIKAPNGKYGVTITGGKCSLGTLKTGEYISVPNSASYFRKGSYLQYNKNPVKAGIYIAGTDKWGQNRRNIMTYHQYYQNNNITNKTIVTVYASYDNGKLLKRKSSGKRDTIYYNGHKTKKFEIPTIPKAKLIANIILKIVKNLNTIQIS